MPDNNSIKIRPLLYPISFLYGIGVRFRNLLFDWGILRSHSFHIPIISVGNITVGGTGKTPHVEYLINLLSQQLNVGVLSRGYKRKSKGFQFITDDTTARFAGDEPYQIKKKYPQITMAIDADRCHGIKEMTKEGASPELEVIILDDAFQHRYVTPGLNILLVDYNRLITEDKLLPAGQLREPTQGSRRADIIIITKCPPEIKPMEFRILSKQFRLRGHQQLFYSSIIYNRLKPLYKEYNQQEKELKEIKKYEVLLVTGIASPKPLIEKLEKYGASITPLTFGDHHHFTKSDISFIRKQFEALTNKDKILITTEKDAVRFWDTNLLDEEMKASFYYLPIEIGFLQNQQETFNQIILEYVRKNKRNSILSERKNDL